jgi:hypothetical protein
MIIKFGEIEGYLNDNSHNNQEPGCVVEHVLSGSILLIMRVGGKLMIFRRGIKHLRQFKVYEPSDDIIILKGNIYDF